MSTSYKFSNPRGLYYITFATVNWIDVFTRPKYKDINPVDYKYSSARNIAGLDAVIEIDKA